MEEERFNLLASLLAYLLGFGLVFAFARIMIAFGSSIIYFISMPEEFFTNKMLFLLTLWIIVCLIIIYIVYFVGMKVFEIGYFYWKRYKDGSKDTN
jgi:hypothetical protein